METNFRRKLSELKEGDRFRFDYDPPGRIRTCLQVGKTELYAPYDGQNTMGHSMSSGDEVYCRSSTEVTVFENKL